LPKGRDENLDGITKFTELTEFRGKEDRGILKENHEANEEQEGDF
jgi:hypothetical protein